MIRIYNKQAIICAFFAILICFLAVPNYVEKATQHAIKVSPVALIQGKAIADSPGKKFTTPIQESVTGLSVVEIPVDDDIVSKVANVQNVLEIADYPEDLKKLRVTSPEGKVLHEIEFFIDTSFNPDAAATNSSIEVGQFVAELKSDYSTGKIKNSLEIVEGNAETKPSKSSTVLIIIDQKTSKPLLAVSNAAVFQGAIPSAGLGTTVSKDSTNALDFYASNSNKPSNTEAPTSKTPVTGASSVKLNGGSAVTARGNDLCPLDPNKNLPGVCGCGVSDADTDGDGSIECQAEGSPGAPNASRNVSPFQSNPVVSNSAIEEFSAVIDGLCVKEGKLSAFFKPYVTLPTNFNQSSSFTDFFATLRIPASLQPVLASEVNKCPCVIGLTNVRSGQNFKLSAFSVNDPQYSQQQNLNLIKYADAIPKFESLTNNWSKKVTVGTIDTGFDYSNVDSTGLFATNSQGSNFVQSLRPVPGESTDRPQDTDIDGHGTSVASLIAAKVNNNIGISGIAPNISQMYPLRFVRNALDLKNSYSNPQNFSRDLFEAIKLSVNAGAEIINISMSATNNEAKAVCDPIVGHAIYKAIEKKVFFVISAGNGVLVDENNVSVPGELAVPRDDGPQKFGYTAFPACWGAYFRGAVTVAALDSSGTKLLGDSNFGESVEIAAPGENIVTYGINNKIQSMSGTSMSAPQVSAAVALLSSTFKANQWGSSPWLLEDVLKNGSPSNKDLSKFVRNGKFLDLDSLAKYTQSLVALTEAKRQEIPSDDPRIGSGFKGDDEVDNIDRLILSADKTELAIGEAAQLKANLLLKDGSLKDVTNLSYFTSSDNKKAQVVARTGAVTFTNQILPNDPVRSFKFIAHYKGKRDFLTIRLSDQAVITKLELIAPDSINFGSTQALKVNATTSSGTIVDVTSSAAVNSSNPAELRVIDSKIISAQDAKGGQSYILSARYKNASVGKNIYVVPANLNFEIFSPLGKKVYKGQSITLFSRFISPTNTATIATVATWKSPSLNINSTGSSLTIDTSTLNVGKYSVKALATAKGNGSNQEVSQDFEIEVTEDLDRIELITKTPVISYKERAAFYLRIFLPNNSFLVVDPAKVSWSTNDNAKLRITPQGIVIPTINSLDSLAGNKRYTVNATYGTKTISQSIIISPVNYVTGNKADLAYVKMTLPNSMQYRANVNANAVAVYTDGSERNVTGSANWTSSVSSMKFATAYGGEMVHVSHGSDVYGGTQALVSVLYEGQLAQQGITINKVLNKTLSFSVVDMFSRKTEDVPNGNIYKATIYNDSPGSGFTHPNSFTIGTDLTQLPNNYIRGIFYSGELTSDNKQLADLLENRLFLVNQYVESKSLSALPAGNYNLFLKDAVYRGGGFDEKINGQFTFSINKINVNQSLKISLFGNTSDKLGDNVDVLVGTGTNYSFHLVPVNTVCDRTPCQGALNIKHTDFNLTIKDLSTGVEYAANHLFSSSGIDPTRVTFFLMFQDTSLLGHPLEISIRHIASGTLASTKLRLHEDSTYVVGQVPNGLPAAPSVSPKVKDSLCTAQASSGDKSNIGSGSVASPYLICTPRQLVTLPALPNAGSYGSTTYYLLGNNLDLSTISDMKTIDFGQDFRTFDINGNGYRITNLRLIDSEKDSQGLFNVRYNKLRLANIIFEKAFIRGRREVGVVSGGVSGDSELTNISVVDSDVHGESSVGGVIGRILNSKFENIFIYNTNVKVELAKAGSVIGDAGSVKFKNISSSGSVSSVGVQNNQASIGGLVGNMSDGAIFNAKFTGSINCGNNGAGASSCGGAVGYYSVNSIMIDKNTFKGQVTSRIEYVNFEGNITSTGSKVGGIIGYYYGYTGNRYSTQGIVYGCGAKGSIFAGSDSGSLSKVGGIIGEIDGVGVINNSISEMSIRGNDAVGGLVGVTSSEIRISNSKSRAQVSSSSGMHGGFIGKINTVYSRTSLTTAKTKLEPIFQSNTYSGRLAAGAKGIGVLTDSTTSSNLRNLDVLGVTNEDGSSSSPTNTPSPSISRTPSPTPSTSPTGGNRSAWQNPRLATDTNNNGEVSALDVLVIINRLNGMGSGILTGVPNFAAGDFYYDVNGDGALSALDALIVINYLNSPR